VNLGLVFLGCHKRGGVERSVWELARALSSRHEVTVYAEEIDDAGLDGVHTVVVPQRTSGASRSLTFAAAARGRLHDHQHDHVVSFGVGDVGADVLWVNSVHRAWLQQSARFAAGDWRSSRLRRLLPRHQLLLAMERHYFRNSSAAVVVVADHVGDDLHRLYRVRRDRRHTIHNGFDPGEFSPGRRQTTRDRARASIGLPADAIALLMVANELPRKGFGVLLDAVARVADTRLHVLLAGRTAPTAYEHQVKTLGLSSRFRYLGSADDIGFVHAAADAFVLPTRYEAFCLAIVEALASGLPVITTTVAGAGDLIEHNRNGLLLHDPMDVGELADLITLACDPQARTRWGHAATASVQDLTWGAIASQADELLSALPSLRTLR
jgi:glycosyltransferase involved in cell wall biosynthesis